MAGDSSESCEPEAVLVSQVILDRGEEMLHVLVQWKGKSAKEAT